MDAKFLLNFVLCSIFVPEDNLAPISDTILIGDTTVLTPARKGLRTMTEKWKLNASFPERQYHFIFCSLNLPCWQNTGASSGQSTRDGAEGAGDGRLVE
jgi:hypothetical protein